MFRRESVYDQMWWEKHFEKCSWSRSHSWNGDGFWAKLMFLLSIIAMETQSLTVIMPFAVSLPPIYSKVTKCAHLAHQEPAKINWQMLTHPSNRLPDTCRMPLLLWGLRWPSVLLREPMLVFYSSGSHLYARWSGWVITTGVCLFYRELLGKREREERSARPGKW